MGDVLNQGLIRMIETWGDNTYTHELFHYFGDPAMKIWTANPNSNMITASHVGSLLVGSTSLSITDCNCSDGLATLVFNEELIGETTLSGGSGTITFPALTNAAPTATLTISKHNWKPYTSNITVVDAVPDISINPLSFSESLGSNETLQRTLSISNDGQSGSILNYDLIIENNTRSLNSILLKQALVIKGKIASGLQITSEEYEILERFENISSMLFPTTGRASATCYPANSAYWSGTTTNTSKTDNSEARAYGGTNAESGWVKFDVSEIPDGSAINSIEFHFYVNATNWPYWSTTPVSNDPVTTSASTLYADIIAEETSGFYNQQDESSGYVPGWKSLTLGGGANTDLYNQLNNDWFAIGISSRDSNPIYYLEVDGWNQTNVPYITVNYTPSIPILELTSPNGSEVWANTESHNITWDHSGAALTNVKLELSTNNGTGYSNIIASTPNDGIYEWIVSGSASEECLVRVSDPAVPTTNDVYR
jgi:hypothetical protein